ncbi:unnamed protein product [Boreogadus saida]
MELQQHALTDRQSQDHGKSPTLTHRPTEPGPRGLTEPSIPQSDPGQVRLLKPAVIHTHRDRKAKVFSALHSLHIGNMERPHLALLLLCLLAGFSSARAYPPSRESVTLRANVKTNAEQLVIRLDQYLKNWSSWGPAEAPGAPGDLLKHLDLLGAC